MALSHPTYTDARWSTFNDIGRDQNITQNTYIILGSLPKPYQFNHSAIYDPPHLSGINSPPPPSQPSGHEISPLPPSGFHIGANHISDVHFAVDIAVGLIIRIARLLVDHEDPSNNRRDLKLELKLLYQTLTLTGLAIQEYNDRPLGQSLVNTIAPEVERSTAVLSELLDRISSTGQGLLHTSISNLWRRVWWSRWDGDELVALKVKLSHIRRLLGGFLSALNSVAWMDIGNELRTGYVSLKQFHAVLAQRLPDIGHIQVQAVNVVDHLGQNIPVPFIFCSRWEDFDYIVNGFCKNRAGTTYVTQGDYQVMRSEDSRVINHTEFASTVRPGMVLEMNIILRKNSNFQANKEKCPRPQCRHINLNVTATNGWIECRKCTARFQAAQANDKDEFMHEKRTNHSDKAGDKHHGQQHSGAIGGNGDDRDEFEHEKRTNPSDKAGDQYHGQKHSGLISGNSDDKIASPPARSKTNVGGHINRKMTRSGNDDESQFFCRIHVIYQGDAVTDNLPMNWPNKQTGLRVIIQPSSERVQSIEDVFTRVDSSDSADLVVRRIDSATFQFKRLDPLISKWARLINVTLRLGLPEVLQEHEVEVMLHKLMQTVHSGEEVYVRDGEFDMPLLSDRENTIFVQSQHDNRVFYGLTVKNYSSHNLFPYLVYFDPSDYSIQLWYHPPSAAMPVPLPARHGDGSPSELPIGYGEPNADAFTFWVPDGVASDVGFLRLFVTATYIDMTVLEQSSPFFASRGAKKTRPPPLEVWGAWTYVLRTEESRSQ